eukprot:m.48021 g.48021  ORF g.48021 m.48021 type:complete len:543 (+) comp11004_c0_seq5:102-1730(+)
MACVTITPDLQQRLATWCAAVEAGLPNYSAPTLSEGKKASGNTGPVWSVAFGICTRHGKVSGSLVDPIPPTLVDIGKNLVSTGVLPRAPNAATVERWDNGQWKTPQKHESKFLYSTVILASSSVDDAVAQRIALGGPLMAPRGKSSFINVDQEVELTAGQGVMLSVQDAGAEKTAIGGDLPCLAIYEARGTRYIVTLRYVANTHIPESYRQRIQHARLEKLLQVTPLPSIPPGLAAMGPGSDHVAPAGTGPADCQTVLGEGNVSSHPTDVSTEVDVLAMPEVEQKHVVDVYETIASHWDRTRYKPWPKVVEFLESLPPNSTLADVGCGNGKYLGVRPDVYTCGSDVCKGLVEICRDRDFEVAVCDNMTLCYRDETFDAAISIAVLHHFASEARRQRAVSEIYRILRPGGRVALQAWALEQETDSKRSFPAPDVLVPWKHLNPEEERQAPRAERRTLAEVAGEDLDSTGDQSQVRESTISSASDVLGDQDEEALSDEVVYTRYCHVFAEGELEQLVTSQGFIVDAAFFDRSNWCVVAHKPLHV